MEDADNTNIEARSIELAERAYRLKVRTNDAALKEKLESVGDQLILIEDPERFYNAQTILETVDLWLEDRRSLAHELNTIDKQINGQKNTSFAEVLLIIRKWVEGYSLSPSPAVKEYGLKMLELLSSVSSATTREQKKHSLISLLESIEDLLVNTHTAGSKAESTQRVRMLRSLRDAVIVQRELQVDEQDLLQRNDQEISQGDRVKAAREVLEEVYSGIKT